jgi:SRSO17 transposase
MPLQWFIGQSRWDDRPLREELSRQIGQSLGDEEGVIVFDPSGFPKSGKDSVGVARQWCGRLGKVENCQVAVYLGYVSRHEQALVDTRLYLPKDWAKDKSRRQKSGIPKTVRYRTRHQLCLEMLERHGSVLPHRWIAGDDELGRPAWFRQRLTQLNERYLLAVPSNTLIRDWGETSPLPPGRGSSPKPTWQRVDRWVQTLEATAWTTIDVRDGTKGPLIVEAIQTQVTAKTSERREGPEETLVVLRYRDRDQQRVVKTDYYLSNGERNVSLEEYSRVAKAEHRIEECLQRAKSQAGLADYEVRHWKGWQHHQTLCLIASWFLVTETQRGKKIDACDHAASDSNRDRRDLATYQRLRSTATAVEGTTALASTK